MRRRGRPGPRQLTQPPPPGPRTPPPSHRPPSATPTSSEQSLQGRALSTPLGWYRLQEDWTKLTVITLRDVTTPGNGLQEACRRPKTLASPPTHPGPARLDPPHRVGPGPDTRHRHQRHTSRDHTPAASLSGEGPASRPEPPGAMGTGHRTNPQHCPPRRQPPHRRRQPPSPTYRQ